MKTLNQNLANIENLQHDLLAENFENLKLLTLSSVYLSIHYEKLKQNKEDQNNNNSMINKIKIQQERFKTLIIKQLKELESDLIIQLWFKEDYDDDLYLGSRFNTELLKNKIHNYVNNWNKKNNPHNLDKLIQFCKKVFKLLSDFGVEVIISEKDIEDLLLKNDFKVELGNILNPSKKRKLN